jgi:hypothetical protein
MRTITQVAAELGVRHWHIRHAFDAGYVDRPPIFSGRFVFNDDDIATLKSYFSRKAINDSCLENIFSPEGL